MRFVVGSLPVGVGGPCARLNVSSVHHLLPDQWTHVMVTWNANMYAQVYINGVLDASALYDYRCATNPLSGTPTQIGKIYNATTFDVPFYGQLDELSIYSKTLDATSIKPVSYTHLTLPTSDLV